jgi:zinc transport system ATP-binding protein
MSVPSPTLIPVSSPREFAVEVKDLRVVLGTQPVLNGVTLEIPKGEVVALIGPNGSGKTTLLRTLLGLQKPDSGTVEIFGSENLEDVFNRIGYMPQRLDLEKNFNISVREFLSLRLKSTRHWFWKSHKTIDTELKRNLAEIGVENLLNRPLARLSGGQLQRVMIAFSLLHNPELLLLDEPTAGVDLPGEQTFYELISQVQKQRHLTVVLVSHDLSMVYRHATWVFALNGVICCQGSPEEVMNAESLKQAYGINVAPYHHDHNHGGHGHSHSHSHSHSHDHGHHVH